MLIKLQYFLPGLLIVATAAMVTHSFELGMMGLTTFGLAYLTKGIRRVRSTTRSQKP
jgi:hypothetical protein